MNTPICDFVNRYNASGMLRLHMPGHKGKSILGFEGFDITEIEGADSLYEARGIISESEANASKLFGSDTFYSAEGSSLCIRAMLYLAVLYAKKQGKRPVIAAGRNAHKVFINTAAVLDFDVKWIFGENGTSYLSCKITPESLEETISSMDEKPCAVYITSPDYLGNIADIKGISAVCRRHGCLLLVDNAHGAYLKFLKPSKHPIDLGADICCDSAHKTLPVLTGGAYLHVSQSAPKFLAAYVKAALGMFGSTSPSYLILQSLDMANRYISEGYSQKLSAFADKIIDLKKELALRGFCFAGDEVLKLTLAAKSYGYKGFELAEELSKRNVMCEFSDPDFVVLMMTPEIGDEGIERLKTALYSIPKKTPVLDSIPKIPVPEKIISIREALLSPKEELSVSRCCGRILADSSVSCPPAVPVIVSGEMIDDSVIECFKYYGTDKCMVVK